MLIKKFTTLLFACCCLLFLNASAMAYSILDAGTHVTNGSYSLDLSSIASSNGPVTGRKITLTEVYTPSIGGQPITRNSTYINTTYAGLSNRPAGTYQYSSAVSCFQYYNSQTWTNCSTRSLSLTIKVARSVNQNLEAEFNDGSFGIGYENTTDGGGGQNAAFIHKNDYIEWSVYVPQTGFYSVSTRSAATINARIDILLNGALKADIGVTKTNGWQNWQTFTSTAFEIPAGFHTLRTQFSTTDQNLNWIKLNSEATASVPVFDGALWRLASRTDLRTLTRDSALLTSTDYRATSDQQWRLAARGAKSYDLRLESTSQCLSSSNTSAILSSCNTSASNWNIDILRKKTEDHPAIYLLKNSNGQCLRPGINGAAPSIDLCNNNARWYIEPVGFNERHFAQEYEVKGLLIIKPQTNIPGVTVGSLSTNLINAVRSAHEINLPTYFSLMTDGRVKFISNTVISNEPIKSLTVYESCNSTNIPLAADIPNDTQRYVTQGKYDAVQVFYNSGVIPGGGGCGPGRSASSNHAMWTTVNEVEAELEKWMDPSQVRSRTEIFIHEPMHGYDSYHETYGLAVPDGGVHTDPEHHYSSGPEGALHWYRDYWLGTVIAPDDTYRGYGPRMFRLPTVRQVASAEPQTTVKITQSTSGKCFIPQSGSTSPVNGELIVLSSNCTTAASSFILEQNGMLKHQASGKCIHPQGGTANNNTVLVLDNSCNYEYRLEHALTDGGSLKNIQTNRCVHPNGGSSNPSEGTALLYHDGCDEERLQFKLVRH